jgi:hypothetical protein
MYGGVRLKVVTPVRRRDDHSEDDFSNIRFEYSDESLNWKSPIALKKRMRTRLDRRGETSTSRIIS